MPGFTKPLSTSIGLLPCHYSVDDDADLERGDDADGDDGNPPSVIYFA
jgi:hypothetical protein